MWGQGDVQTFEGAPSDNIGYDGELRTGWAGVDVSFGDRWLAGGAVSGGVGSAAWRAGAGC